MPPGSAPVRPAAAAGRFYPAPPDVLRRLMQQLEAQAAAAPSDVGFIKALVAPHAGYPFSGPVAAGAFRSLRAQRDRIRRVVLFGPAHFEAFSGLAVPSAESFATPLGDVAVDRAAVSSLLELPGVRELDSPHAPEHALEVELPFLIDALGGADSFTIVPLLFSDADSDQAAAALRAVWGGDETLVVVSSDLSHYLDYETATRCDRTTADAILADEPQAVGPDSACGHVALRGLMRVVKEHGLRCTRLDVRNSHDTAPHLCPRDRVVGYGAFLYTR